MKEGQLFVQEEVTNVEEKSSGRGSLLSVKRPVRRTVSDDDRLQQQQLQQLPMLTTQHLSRARNDLSPVSRPIYVHTHARLTALCPGLPG